MIRNLRPRVSVPVFYQPDPSAVIDPAGLGVSRAQALYPPIAVGAYLQARFNETFPDEQQVA
jgi:hypothetical protein